jgi:hypothetical protein
VDFVCAICVTVEIKKLMAKRHQLLTTGVSTGLNRHLGPIEANLSQISTLIDAARKTDLSPLFTRLSFIRLVLYSKLSDNRNRLQIRLRIMLFKAETNHVAKPLLDYAVKLFTLIM